MMRALILDFDGTLYLGDLPVQAYARHVADQLPEPDAIGLIAALRFFLEGKFTELPGPGGSRSSNLTGVDLQAAEDGFHAVEILGAAAGLGEEAISAAYRAARRDLAASAFALEAPEGLPELLAELGDVHVRVVTNADADGVQAVLTAIGVARYVDDVVTDAGKPASMPGLVQDTLAAVGAGGEPARLLAVGDRWAMDLAAAHAAGAVTALIDRFGRGDGSPTFRAPDFAGLIPHIRRWARR